MYEPIKSDVNEFLDKAKKERENRRLDILKIKSAILIQKTFRGYASRCRLFISTRSEYVVLINDLTAVEVRSLSRAIKCLRFRFSADRDRKELELLARQLILSVDSAKSATSFVSLVLKKETIADWIRTSNWILRVSVQLLGRVDPASQSDSKLMNVLLTVCLNLLTVGRWRFVVGLKNAGLEAQMNKITDSLYARLLKNDLFSTLKELLLKGVCRQNISLSQISLNGIMSLILKIFNSNSISDGNLLNFIIHVLSVPALIKHMNIMVNEVFQSLVRDRVCTRMVLFLAEKPQAQARIFEQLQASYSLCIIANIIDLGLLEMDVLANHGSEFCTVLSSLLVQLNTSINLTSASAASHYHHIFGWSGVHMDESIQSSIAHLRGQLRLLWSSKMIRSMFDELYEQPILDRGGDSLNLVTTQSMTTATTGSSTSSGTSSLRPPPLFRLPRLGGSGNFWRRLHLLPHKQLQQQTSSGSGSSAGGGIDVIAQMPLSIQSVCMLYFFTTSCLSQIRDDILAGVSLTDLPARMWRLIKSSASLRQWASLVSCPDAGWKSLPHPTHLLHMFVLVANHLFIILDDVEVFDKEKVFTVVEVKEMADFFNKLFVEVAIAVGNETALESLLVLREQHLLQSSAVHNGTSSVRAQSHSMVPLALTTASAGGGRQRSSLDLCSLYGSCHRLLMILHERDVRHPFTTDGFWLSKVQKPANFMSDLAKDRPVQRFLLKQVPHIIPHKERIVLFRERVKAEKSGLGLIPRNWNHDDSPIGAVISVRRCRIVEDGYEQLMKVAPDDWKKKIRVRFINELGMDEVGIDLDGVFKEFLEESVRRLLDPGLGLFSVTAEHRLYPSPLSGLYEQNHLCLFQYLGRLMAKAVYEGLLVEAPFAHFFLTQLLRKEQAHLYSFLDELATFDRDLYKSLTYVKHFDGDISELELTFSYDEDRLGQLQTHDLRPGGRYMTVTNDTRISYVHMVARFRMFVQLRDQTRSFVAGFYSLLRRDWLDVFSVPETLRLLCGDSAGVDIDDLRANVKYSGGFHAGHRVVVWLWDVLKHDFSDLEKGLFLKFVTSCSKPPLLGFSHLTPPFSVRCVHSNEEEHDFHSPAPPPPASANEVGGATQQQHGESLSSLLRTVFSLGGGRSSSQQQGRSVRRSHKDPGMQRLPSAATCFNLLKLPNYSSRSVLRDKLRYVVHAGAGFELS